MGKSKDKLITKAKVKSEYGFTDKLIEEFLKEPDETMPNPYSKRAAPMKLYKVKRVERIVKTKKFQKAFEKTLVRKISAKKSVETKKNKTLDEIKKKIKKIKVELLDVSDDKLRDLAIDNVIEFKRYINELHGNYDGMEFEARFADDATIDRWTVNYIRHNLTKYDDDLYNMKGKVGRHEVYIIYKEAVLNKIAEVYPKYKDECNRQLTEAKNCIKLIEEMKAEIY